MAIAFRGSRTGSSAAGSVAISATTGWTTAAPQAGDVLVAIATCSDPSNNDAFLNTPSGWTLVGQVGTPSGYPNEVRMMTRAWVNTDTTYTFVEGSGFAPQMTVTVLAFSGADTTSPGAGSASGQGTGTGITVPSVTAAVANCWLVAGVFQTDTTTALSAFGTMTNRASVSEAVALTRGTGATEALTASGATGTRSLTAGAAGSGYAAIGLALRPLVTVTPDPTPVTGGGSPPPRPRFTDPYAIARLDDDLLIL